MKCHEEKHDQNSGSLWEAQHMLARKQRLKVGAAHVAISSSVFLPDRTVWIPS